MNPLRSLFLAISRMPPSVMLLIIIGLAVVVTMMVTARVDEEEHTQSMSISSTQKGAQKSLIYSLSYIPSGCKIERKQVQLKTTPELEAWDDAQTELSDVVGAAAKHPIPAYAQIRKVDLE